SGRGGAIPHRANGLRGRRARQPTNTAIGRNSVRRRTTTAGRLRNDSTSGEAGQNRDRALSLAGSRASWLFPRAWVGARGELKPSWATGAVDPSPSDTFVGPLPELALRSCTSRDRVSPTYTTRRRAVNRLALRTPSPRRASKVPR